MAETSGEIADLYYAHDQKLNYFMAATSAALAGYLGEGFQPKPLGWNPSLLELASLVLFCLAVYASIKAIEGATRHLQVNAEKGKSVEKIKAIADATAVATRHLQANVEKVEILEKQAADLKKAIDADLQTKADEQTAVVEFDGQMAEIRKGGVFWYKVRPWFLYGGFVLLLVARVWQAYDPPAASPAASPAAALRQQLRQQLPKFRPLLIRHDVGAAEQGSPERIP